MPTIAELIELPGVFSAGHIIVRALLQHGRTYEQAVQMFEPYEKIQEPDNATLNAIREIAEMAVNTAHPEDVVALVHKSGGFDPGTVRRSWTLSGIRDVNNLWDEFHGSDLGSPLSWLNP